MHKRILIFTGVGGILGGLGTLALGSSCDLECVQDDRPSVVVRFRSPNGSSISPVSASEVTFEHRSHPADDEAHEDTLAIDPPTERAVCLDHACSMWSIGADETGRFDIEATVCGKTHEVVAEVEADIDGCHAATQYVDVTIDSADCDGENLAEAEPKRCDLTARPSALVYVASEHDDYLQAEPVERVWYQYQDEERVREATCATGPLDEDGKCSLWLAGWEQPGRFRIYTQWCDTVVRETAAVEMTEDGCHVDTEFVVLPVSTRGCETSEPADIDPTQPPIVDGAMEHR